jgi:hypothetical protein
MADTERTRLRPDSAKSETVAPVACSLDAGGKKTRFDEWRELKRVGLVGESREGRVLTTVWTAEAGIPARLEMLIEAERQCCAFLDFEVEELDDVIRVRTVFPEGAESLLVSFTE